MSKQVGKPKSWLNLTVEELERIVETGETPPNLDWNTLPEHPQFPRLFRLRDNPAKLAKVLLTEKAPERVRSSKPQRVEYKGAIPLEMRERRLKLREVEAEIQKSRIKQNTILFEKVCQVETDVKTLKKMMKIILDILRDLDARSRGRSQ
ncbi:MAG: hypothetical protein ACWGQW_04855 [bacterium]